MKYTPSTAYYRRTRARRTIYGLLSLIMMIVVGAHYILPSHTQHTHAAVETPPPPFSVQPQWPAHVAAAAVGAAGYGVLATTGDTHPRPTASIAKIITTLAVLEKHPLSPPQTGPNISFTVKDTQRYSDYLNKGGSVVPVQAGTSFTERQALEAMLLPSANNIADTTAVWAFGSLSNYQKYANQMVQRLGLHNTTVGTDASGYDPSTTSTSSDLIKLGDLALKNPTIAQIVAQPATSNLPVGGTQPNYNRLVTLHSYTGIKIGDSDEAGITLLFSTDTTFQGKKVTLIGVVLGADRNFAPQESAFQFMEATKQTLK